MKALTRTATLFAAIVALTALAGVGPSAQAAERCRVADECHGPLPQICERCRDGHDVCAHWACVRHRCVVEICPGRYHR
jgi:hypothetical protein